MEAFITPKGFIAFRAGKELPKSVGSRAIGVYEKIFELVLFFK